MTDFSLIDLIRRVIAETDLAMPEDIAAKVGEMVPPKQLRAALAEALPHIVRIELTRDRGRGTVRRAPNPSSKVAAIRQHLDAWRKRLRDRIAVGDGEWKMLADCTATDLRTAASQRRAFAAGALSAAEEFELLAGKADDRAAARIENQQMDLLTGEAVAMDAVWRLGGGLRVKARHAVAADVLAWLDIRGANAQRVADAFAADRALVAELLVYMPTADVTVEQAVEARTKAKSGGQS